MTRFFYEDTLTGALNECLPATFGRAPFESDYAVTVWVFDEGQSPDFESLEILASIEWEAYHTAHYLTPQDGLMIR
jgi:hypothetical protein